MEHILVMSQIDSGAPKIPDRVILVLLSVQTKHHKKAIKIILNERRFNN